MWLYMESRIQRNGLSKMLLVMTREKEQLIKKTRKKKMSSIFFRFQTEFLALVVVQNSGADRENLHLKLSGL